MATDGKGNVEVADSGLGARLSCRVFQKEVDVLSSIKEYQPMEWMSTPVRGLGSKSPLDMMRTRRETNVVIDPAGRPTGEGCSRVRSDRCVITSHLTISLHSH